MLKALAIALAAATIVVSGVAVAGESKVRDLAHTETFISEKLLIVPVDEDGLVRVSDTRIRKKVTPKS